MNCFVEATNQKRNFFVCSNLVTCIYKEFLNIIIPGGSKALDDMEKII